MPPDAPPVSASLLWKTCWLSDGETDDTAAIQAAIDAGRSVYLPSGIYVLSREVRVWNYWA